MESKDPTTQLDELRRLRAATVRESHRTPVGTTAVLLAGMVAFFAAHAFVKGNGEYALSGAWMVFIGGWLLLLRRSRRAVPPRTPRTSEQRRREARQGGVVGAVANMIAL